MHGSSCSRPDGVPSRDSETVSYLAPACPALLSFFQSRLTIPYRTHNATKPSRYVARGSTRTPLSDAMTIALQNAHSIGQGFGNRAAAIKPGPLQIAPIRRRSPILVIKL